MHPVVRVLGRMLSLVGISSPEDAVAKKQVAGGPPSWKKPVQPPKVEAVDAEKKQD